ncbi:MAG: nicotinamide riboside transporter PnuC [Bacteroidales bacterium]|nr:nicotinamide riboside transporter PnuC [Bacteroidales bacterium]
MEMYPLLSALFSSLTWKEYVEIFGTIIGLVYMYFQYTANPRVWYVSIVNSLPFIGLNFVVGNYASFLLFVYYLVVAVWSIFVTPDTEKEQGVFYIRPIPRRMYLPLLAVTAALTGLIYWGQLHIESIVRFFSATAVVAPAQAPLLDSFATALSFVGMWLLARKYLEQWLLWIVVNVAFIYVYIASATYLWAVLFFAYALIAILGYMNWKKLMKQQVA